MSKFLGFNDVLVLSPHPDDAEYAMSGTVCKYTDTTFHIFLMSLGTATDDNEGRWDEVNNYWQARRPGNVQVNLMNGISFEDPMYAWTDFVDQFWGNLQFDAVMGPTGQDSHFEHTVANSLMHSMVRKYPASVIEYRCISTLHDWVPNLFVELNQNQYIMKALYMRDSFKSQLDSRYFEQDALRAFHSDFASMKKGMEYVEPFRVLLHYER